jgi:NAD(P)-dependent dehydrogenase (short-subunit alcohol dehydrogenase family)
MPKLIDKVALVTGGSRGIGAVIAKRLAGDGASVAGAGRLLGHEGSRKDLYSGIVQRAG